MSARREFLIGLGAALAWSLPVPAQLPRMMYRVGFLGNTTAALEETGCREYTHTGN